MPQKLTFIGLGLMGKPMVQNLLQGDFELTLWNRTKEKCLAFSGQASLARSAEEAVSNADIIITMLENGPVVDQVLYQSGAIRSIKAGTLVIDMSSISPEMARHHSNIVTQIKSGYLDAPVSGGTTGAQQARLSIMAGGEKSTFEAARQVFDCLGTPTHIGPAGSGQLAKLANQAIVGITIGAISEALLLAAQGGADPSAVREALLGGFAGSKILELHGQRMINRDFEPGARSSIQLKDLRMILDEARNSGLTLPLTQRVYDEYLALCASGNGEVDHSGLLLQLEQLNQTRMR
ncbi:MAG: 2-hydroxy-3-oxopropionate reductase [Proteobacteria bacterium]|nr:MAG: 2-hydroxy-3-oxopropionate reductase [Pseudomonadota bacterium]